MRYFIHTSTTAALTVAAVASLQSAARADVTICYYISNSTFEYKITHMPDLDQRRDPLPNNGANHCVPTASMNLFAYASNHGYPMIEPGAANWQSNGNFVAATNAIQDLGQLMQTSGTSGTNGSNGYAGLQSWAGDEALGLVTTFKKSKNSEYTPTVAKMVSLACQGWIVSFAYGRYDIVGNFGDFPVLDRDGGHAVTLQYAKRGSGSSYQLRYRNPANDDYLPTQSGFCSTITYPVAYTASFGGTDIRTMNAIGYPSEDGKVRLVDSYWGIRPTYVYTFGSSNNLQGLGGGTIRMIDPMPLEGSINLALPEITISNFTYLEGLIFHPEMTSALVLTRSVFNGQPSILRSMDLLTGQMTALPGAPEDLVEITSSREEAIFGFDPLGKLYKLDIDGNLIEATSAVPQPSSISFDNETDRLGLVSVPDRRVAKYTKSLDVVENFIVPTTVPMSGKGIVRIDPTTGKCWFKTDASGLLYNVTPGAAGNTVTILTPTTVPGGIENFQFGSNGELYLLGNTQMKVMKKTSPTTWALDTASPFHNQPGGSLFMVSKNFSNEDPAIHDSVAWRNIPADQLIELGTSHPDCDEDLNADDVVDGADLGMLLGAWGTANGAADFNQDGVVDGADLGQLLGHWGNCP